MQNVEKKKCEVLTFGHIKERKQKRRASKYKSNNLKRDLSYREKKTGGKKKE